MGYLFLRFPGGKSKAVTLSYDDGVQEDIKFLEIINKYGLKCTFNLMGYRVNGNSPLSKEFIESEMLNKGHEIAVHGFYHRALNLVKPVEAIRDVLNCRMTLEKTFNRIVRGMAFPDIGLNRNYYPEAYSKIKPLLESLDIAYARTSGGDNDNFNLPEDWLNWIPTIHHNNANAFEYIDKFLSLDVNDNYSAKRQSRLFFMWGHSYEFERANNWERLEEICQKLSNKEDIWYATNMEICSYVKAYESLVYSADTFTIYNPTLYEIWLELDKVLYSIKPGETLRIDV